MTETGKQQPANDDKPSRPEMSFTCPHCGHAQVVQIRAGEIVAVGTCSSCGELVAPAKKQ